MVLLLTCTFNRLSFLKRIIRFYLDQEYDGESFLFIYNNSPSVQALNNEAIKLPANKRIVLINNTVDLKTNKEYIDVGSIHRDAIYIAEQHYKPDVVTFFEDDNIYLKDHISCGMAGIESAYKHDCVAYKPHQSYRTRGVNAWLESNIFEPSFFIDFEFLKQHQFRSSAVDFHWQWITPLLEENKLFVDLTGKPTLIYVNHSSNLSSMMNNSTVSMLKHRKKLNDIGDGLITPIAKEEAEALYKLVKKASIINKFVSLFSLKK